MSATQPQHDAQYAQLDIGDDVVIYDVNNHSAWIQSDGATDREAIA